jgi:hypothetical protein
MLRDAAYYYKYGRPSGKRAIIPLREDGYVLNVAGGKIVSRTCTMKRKKMIFVVLKANLIILDFILFQRVLRYVT